MKNKEIRKTITLLVIFVLFVLTLIGCSIMLFETDQPFLGFVGVVVTLLVLIWFPYERFFKEFSNNFKK